MMPVPGSPNAPHPAWSRWPSCTGRVDDGAEGVQVRRGPPRRGERERQRGSDNYDDDDDDDDAGFRAHTVRA